MPSSHRGNIITRLKASRSEVKRPFLVADFETVINEDDQHVGTLLGVIRALFLLCFFILFLFQKTSRVGPAFEQHIA